jgi:predicted XRE-type DNA-binding protein
MIFSFIQDEVVQKVVEFMDTYSLSQEDFNTTVEVSKFKGSNIVESVWFCSLMSCSLEHS